MRAKEVQRFQSDLMGLSTHGVFVSLHSGIVGKREVEIEALSTGKFAVYLSNNKYDVDAIYDWLLVLYRLDDVLKKGDTEGAMPGCVTVTAETLKRVQLYLKDFSQKVSMTKTHLRESLSLLNELTLELIEQVLLGQVSSIPHKAASLALSPPAAEKTGHVCPDCGKVCRTTEL